MGVVEETSGLGEPPGHGPAADLGRKLFFDPVLSSTGTVSCATCHDPARGYTSGGRAPRLDGGSLALRAPTLLNRGAGRRFMWDGRAKTLEEQAVLPISNPHEMGDSLQAAFDRASRKYPGLRGVDDLPAALAAFERTLASPRTRFDDHLDGANRLSLTAAEARGWDLFRGRAECYKCHTGRHLTDDQLHDTGLGGKFKTPGLRACRTFGGYGHDGRFATLAEVVDHYDRGGGEAKRLGLTAAERADLVAFLESL